MIHTWKRQIPCESKWVPRLLGLFFRKPEQVFFFYKDKAGICALGQNAVNPLAISVDVSSCSQLLSHIEKSQGNTPLPSEWLLFEDYDPPYLLLSSEIGINLLHMEPCDTLPSAATEYYHLQKSKKEREGVLLQTDDYCVCSNGECSYVCKRNGKKQWTFSGQAYISTPMICCQDSLVFGTAGNGGHLYVLSIKTGKKIADIKTGGTATFVQHKNLCYFLANDPMAKLLCLDVYTGQIIGEVPLGGKNCESPIKLIGNQLHTITFHFRNSQLHKAIWHCIRLDEDDLICQIGKR